MYNEGHSKFTWKIQVKKIIEPRIKSLNLRKIIEEKRTLQLFCIFYDIHSDLLYMTLMTVHLLL